MRRGVLGLLLLLAATWMVAQKDAGMATYYVVFLRPDPARKALPKEQGERIQAAHMANIRKMADDGVLVSAGPFDDTPTTISGIFVMKTESLQTARAIALKDPTVAAHRNTVDVHMWNGPAEIGDEYFRLHKLDPKTPENMQMHPLFLLYRGAAWHEKGRESVLRAHTKYLMHLKTDHRLSAAGAVEASDELTGIVIFQAGALDAAQQEMAQDPAVKAGVLKLEAHQWWSADHVMPW